MAAAVEWELPMPDPDVARPRPAPDKVQGLVAFRYPQPIYAVLLFSVDDAAKARGFLRDRMHLVPAGDRDPAGLTGPVLNFAFTWAGLGELLGGDTMLDLAEGRRALDFCFTDQTPDHPAVAESLGFIGKSAAANWWGAAFAHDSLHMAAYVASDDDVQAASALAELRDAAASSGLRELRLPGFSCEALSGYRPEGGVLHFGYRDGITSPRIDWADARTEGTVNFREFLMGYPEGDAYPVAPTSPGPWQDFVRDGSFACLAWIRQDVAAFNRFLDDNAGLGRGRARSGKERDWVAAKILGRWPSGSPLVRHPEGDAVVADLGDDFGYADDPEGNRCPLTAHIRVVNPRDEPLTFPNGRRFPAGPPRLIRRGFSYGPRLQGAEDDGVDRGLIGTFLCARVNEQFYTVLRWMQETGFAEGFHRRPYEAEMQDALIGCRDKPGAQTAFMVPPAGGGSSTRLPDFVSFKGVAVLFLPGMACLRRLAAS